MAKGKHRESQRIVLPNGMWLLIYEGGRYIKLAGYEREVKVTEVLNRAGGGHVFVEVAPSTDQPREVAPRPTDLVTVERPVLDTLHRAAGRST